MDITKIHICLTNLTQKENYCDIFTICLKLGNAIYKHLKTRYPNNPEFTAEIHKNHFLFKWYMKEIDKLLPINMEGLENIDITHVSYASEKRHDLDNTIYLFDLKHEALLTVPVNTLDRFLQLITI